MPIREFTANDYQGYADVVNAVYPEYPETLEELRHTDEKRSDKTKFARFVATNGNGEIVGVGQYSQSLRLYHPHKFQLEVSVAPTIWGRGYGTALYHTLTEALTPHEPIGYRTFVREDHEHAKQFADSRGFAVVQREQESALDLSGFDPATHSDELERATAQGIRLASYTELKAETDDLDALHRRIEDVLFTIGEDIPHSEPTQRIPYDEFLKRFDDPNFVPEAHFYALDTENGGYFVGLSELWAPRNNPELHTGATGIRREYRKRGIATALKVHALTWAKQRGAPSIRTWNNENNPMLGINHRLGFKNQPAWLIMNKRLG